MAHHKVSPFVRRDYPIVTGTTWKDGSPVMLKAKASVELSVIEGDAHLGNEQMNTSVVSKLKPETLSTR